MAFRGRVIGEKNSTFDALGVWWACFALLPQMYRMTKCIYMQIYYVGYNNSLAWTTLKYGNSATKPAFRVTSVTSCHVVILQPYIIHIIYIYIYHIHRSAMYLQAVNDDDLTIVTISLRVNV